MLGKRAACNNWACGCSGHNEQNWEHQARTLITKTKSQVKPHKQIHQQLWRDCHHILSGFVSLRLATELQDELREKLSLIKRIGYPLEADLEVQIREQARDHKENI